MAISSSGASFDVLIRFVTEMAGDDVAKKAAANFETLEQKVKKSEKALEGAKDAMKKLAGEYERLTNKIKPGMTAEEFKSLENEIKAVTIEAGRQKKIVDATTESHKKLVQQLKQEESQQRRLQAETRKTGEILTNTSEALNRISNTLLLGGTAITGGLFKAAKDFIEKSGEQSQVTREWQQATDEIARSYERVGRVAASELLPFMKQAAEIASDIAGIIERHPELIKGAAQLGIAALTVGTMTKVAAGITGLAGTLLQLASKLGLGSIGASGTTAAGGAAAGAAGTAGLSAAGSAAVLIAAPLIAAILTKEIGNLIQRALGMQESSWKDIGTTLAQAATLPAKLLILELRELGLVSSETAKKLNNLTNTIFGLSGTDKAGTDKAGVSKQVNLFGRAGYTSEELVKDYIDMREAEKEAEKNFQNQRMSIIRDANSAALSAIGNNARAVSQINARAAANRAKIVADFVSSSKEAEQRYAQQRAQIVRDGNLEIQRIEQNRIEQLRKLELEHNDRVEDLAANRDALGLVLEQRRFDRERGELDRQTGIEIAQRRQDLAIRLQDAAQAFAQERAQRQAQYMAQLKENELQRQQALKEQAAAHQEELKQIAKQRAEKLRQLQIQYAEERARIRQDFIAKVRDLNASLLGEQQKRRQYYALMQRDLEAFLARYRAGLNSLGAAGRSSAIPGYATGGYTPDGIIRAHSGEFVTSASTTRALERAIGGRLSQQSLLSLAGGGNSSSSVVWHDHRRFSGEYTKSMRSANRADTLSILGNIIRRR